MPNLTGKYHAQLLNGFQTCNKLKTRLPLYKQMTEIAMRETQDPQTMATWRQ